MIGEIPKFLAGDEVLTAKRFARELGKRIRERRSFSSAELYERNRLLQKRYSTAQSDDERAQLREEISDVQLYMANPRLRVGALRALDSFATKEVAPFTREILIRALEIARKSLAEVTAEENERCIRLTGAPLTFSDIVSAQQRVVDLLTGLLSRVNAQGAFFVPGCEAAIKFLPKLAANGQGPNGNTNKKEQSTGSQKI